MLAQPIDDYSKVFDFFLAEIEYLVDRWGQSIVGDLEIGGHAADKYVGQNFGFSKDIWLLKMLLRGTTICLQNWTSVVNTKEKQAIFIWNWAKTK